MNRFIIIFSLTLIAILSQGATFAAAETEPYTRVAVRTWENLGGEWRFENGEVRCLAHLKGWQETLLLERTIRRDCIVNFRLLATGDNEAGLVVRYRAPDQWIGVLLQAGGAVIYERNASGIHYLAKRRKDVYPPGACTVTVELIETRLTLSIDGAEKLSAELPEPVAGRVGLASNGSADQPGLRIANLSIEAPAKP